MGIQRRGYRLTPELKQWCAAELKISAQAPVNEFRDAVAQAIAAGQLTMEKLTELSQVQVVREVLDGLRADDSVIVGGIQRARDGVEVASEPDPLDPLLFDVEAAAPPELEEDSQAAG